MSQGHAVHLPNRLSTPASAFIASGVLGAVIGLLGVVYPSAVDDDQWSFPFPYSVALAISAVLAVTHVLSLVGFLGVREVGAGWGRTAAAGVWLSLAGFLGLAGCEVASGFIGRKDNDSTIAGIVGSAFGVTSLLSAVGAVLIGAIVLRRKLWTPAGGWATLLSGLVLILFVTPANIGGNYYLRTSALILWSLCFIPMGTALRGRERVASSAAVAA
jgi:hypothetical protein